jgi:hypothetical protein
MDHYQKRKLIRNIVRVPLMIGSSGIAVIIGKSLVQSTNNPILKVSYAFTSALGGLTLADALDRTAGAMINSAGKTILEEQDKREEALEKGSTEESPSVEIHINIKTPHPDDKVQDLLSAIIKQIKILSVEQLNYLYDDIVQSMKTYGQCTLGDLAQILGLYLTLPEDQTIGNTYGWEKDDFNVFRFYVSTDDGVRFEIDELPHLIKDHQEQE